MLGSPQKDSSDAFTRQQAAWTLDRAVARASASPCELWRRRRTWLPPHSSRCTHYITRLAIGPKAAYLVGGTESVESVESLGEYERVPTLHRNHTRRMPSCSMTI